MDFVHLFTLLVFSSNLALALGELHQYKTKIAEDGKKFTQITRVDSSTGMEYFHVPKHGNRDEISVVVDYNRQLVMTKVHRLKQCFLRKMDKNDINPVSLDLGMKKKSHSKFPWHKYVTTSENELIVNKVTNMKALSKAFQKLCQGLDVLNLIPAPKGIKNVEKLALKIIKDSGKKTRKRDVVLRGFVPCDATSTAELTKCLSTVGPQALSAHCRMKYTGCIYYAFCSFQVSGGVFTCKTTHNYHNSFCCNYKCNA